MIRSLFSLARSPEERRVRAWCRQVLHLTPSDLPLYRQALRHSSAVPEGRDDLPDNERLEFLGDAILDAIIGDLLFSTYPGQGEGFLTRMRSKLVSRQQLNLLAARIHIERVMESNVSRGHETSVPGNALEALIGALFLDKGFERTRKAVVRMLNEHFDLKEIEKEDRDAKSRLLEWGQKKRQRVEFQFTEMQGRGRGRIYRCDVRIEGQTKGSGQGPSKKVAEQEAAQEAYARLQHRAVPGRDDRGHGQGERPSGRRRSRGGARRSNKGRSPSDGPSGDAGEPPAAP